MKYNFFLYQYLLVYYLIPGNGKMFGVLDLGKISLALLLMAFVSKLKDMKFYYNKKSIYSRCLLFLLVVLTVMIAFSMLNSNDVNNSLYVGMRFLLHVLIPFYFLLMIRQINMDDIIDLFIAIALIQVGYAVSAHILGYNFFDNFFTYTKDYGQTSIRFDLLRVKTSLGNLPLTIMFVIVYPFSYYKNSFFYKLARYLIPLGTVLTVSLTGMLFILFEIIMLNMHKLKNPTSFMKLTVIVAMLLFILNYVGILEPIIDAASNIVMALGTHDTETDKEFGLNTASRSEGFIYMFSLMIEHILNPIGFGELYNNWHKYILFNTDPGIPLLWGVEVGFWAFLTYIAIFLTAFMLLWKQKKQRIAKYFFFSLFSYFFVTFVTNHISTMVIPFIIFGLLIRLKSSKKSGELY